MPAFSLTSKGQVTVPVGVRRRLGLNPGDRVRFIESAGRVFIERDDTDIASLFGMVKPKRSASLAQIDRAIAAGWTRRARG
jgi:AbrB family looped-hinge helix DNA binding protein